MTRSIFDPTGGETEHSGSTHLGPRADNGSRMPPDLVDGEAEGEGPLEAVDRADDTPPPLAQDSDDAARRLGEMRPEGEE
jgi:hypothetical protein